MVQVDTYAVAVDGGDADFVVADTEEGGHASRTDSSWRHLDNMKNSVFELRTRKSFSKNKKVEPLKSIDFKSRTKTPYIMDGSQLKAIQGY